MSYKKTDRYIEKSFLYILALSLLLHMAMFMVIIFLPQEKKVAKEQPVMIDLQDLPPSKEAPTREKKDVKRVAEEKRRVAREKAPKGEMERERIRLVPQRTTPPAAQPQRNVGQMAPAQPENRKDAAKESAIRRKPAKAQGREGFQSCQIVSQNSGIWPGLKKATARNTVRKWKRGKLSPLDTDDIRFGSFLRRFETAVYGVWSYPREAAKLGIEGMTPVRITFNRKGDIEQVELLKSSGSDILDNEVLRALHHIGPIGSLPKGYTKDKFYLVASFHYEISNGMSRTLD